jgi:hypothetical protein
VNDNHAFLLWFEPSEFYYNIQHFSMWWQFSVVQCIFLLLQGIVLFVFCNMCIEFVKSITSLTLRVVWLIWLWRRLPRFNAWFLHTRCCILAFGYIFFLEASWSSCLFDLLNESELLIFVLCEQPLFYCELSDHLTIVVTRSLVLSRHKIHSMSHSFAVRRVRLYDLETLFSSFCEFLFW